MNAARYPPAVTTQGNVVAQGKGWEIRRLGEDVHELRTGVVPSRWRRLRTAVSWLPALVAIPVILGSLAPRTLAQFGGSGRLGLLLALMYVGPRLARRFREQDVLTIQARTLRWQSTEGSSVPMARPPEGVYESIPTAPEFRRLRRSCSVRFVGGGRDLELGHGLPPEQADAMVAALRAHAPLAREREVVPGCPGVPLLAGKTFSASLIEQHNRGVPARGRPRVGASGPSVAACTAAALGLLPCMIGLGLAPARWPTFLSIALTCVAVLVWLVPGGLRMRYARAARARRRAVHPHEPWRWTGDFESPREVRHALARVFRSSHVYVLVGCALYLLVRDRMGGFVLDVVAAVAAIGNALPLWNAPFLGDTEVTWDDVRAGPGSSLTGTFAVARGGAAFETLLFRLRRLEEQSGMVLPAVSGLACTHEAIYRLPDDVPPPIAGEAVPFRFELPPDTPPTDLDARLPAWWELLVEGSTSRGRYSESFRAPVSARVSAADDAPAG